MPLFTYQRKTAKALICDKTTRKFLLVRFIFSPGSNSYSFVGGGVKENEEFGDALLREMKEEVGLDETAIAKITPLKGEEILRQKFLLFDIENKTQMFLVIIKKTPEIRLNWENKNYIWKGFEEMGKCLNSFSADLLNKCVQKNGEILREV